MITKEKIPRGTRVRNPITCAKCGILDQTRWKGKTLIVGTDIRMSCSDCIDLCRLCCPTHHGTETALG